MDTLERYRSYVSQLINEYAKYKPSHGQIETEAIIDTLHDHYEVMHVGWDGQRRVHGSVVHIDIIMRENLDST
ncbi:fdxN element excision controlling factor protein [Calothrix sp. NIES-4071]|nr:fdxN element excision controlling factor protein [Calothrix sp. NIES-4071]BAZ54386.1 fdxN element excision controlling factor protein [Calothrix sp. NIES-4105]